MSSSQVSAGRPVRAGRLVTLGCARHEVGSEELAARLCTGSEGVDLVAEAIGTTASQPPAPAGMR